MDISRLDPEVRPDVARGRVIHAALLCAAGAHDERADEEPWADAQANYNDDQLALAARDLVRAVDASDRKPIGW